MDDSLEQTKMKIIYNAILMGWTVRQLPDQRFEFSKEKETITTDASGESFLVDILKDWAKGKNHQI